MGRPGIEYLNECRKLHREGKLKPKTCWSVPKLAPANPRVGEKIDRAYAEFLAIRYHRRRQAQIEQAKHLAALGDDIPF